MVILGRLLIPVIHGCQLIYNTFNVDEVIGGNVMVPA